MFCTVNDCEIYYEVVGEGKPILMLHGFPLDHQMMKGCMEPIFKHRHGWKRIYFDLPGIGKSKVADHVKCTDDIVDIVLGFIKEVIGDENFVIAGESYGGVMARAIIYHQPKKVDGLFIFCPATKFGEETIDLPTRNVLRIDEDFVNTLEKDEKEFFQSFAVVQNKYTWHRIKNEVFSGFTIRDKEFIARYSNEESRRPTYDIDNLKKPFDKPSLLLTGRQDHWTGYKGAWDFYENYPRGSYVVLDKAGHGLQYEQVLLFNVLTDEWLDRVEEELEEMN
ncbi:MAG: alpha/beta hydrolase [Candidatus Heimdallarchaeota archaeon]